MTPAHAREVFVVLTHLALWSQLGVLTRIYLDKLFSNGCNGSWGICLSSEGIRRNSLGSYFPDLASNMLGSFLMGLFAASSTLSLPTKKAMAILPASSRWQGTPELHIGLRTGYCGSLTTFASWEYSLVTGLIGGQGKQGGQWAEFLWGLVIGLELSLASYVFGEQCALIADRYLVPGGAHETDLEAIEAQQRETVEAERRGDLGQPVNGPDCGNLGSAVPDGQPLAVEVSYVLQERQGNAVGGSGSALEHGGADVTMLGEDEQRRGAGEASSAGRLHGPSRHAVSGRRNTVSADAGAGGHSSDRARLRTGGDGARSPWLRAFLWQQPEKYMLHRRTNLGTAALLAAVLALFITLAVLDRQPTHKARRAQWLAVLFGPAGCTARWLLSQANYTLPGRWKWLPAGTLAANMIACLVDYVVGGIADRAGGGLGYWPWIILYAIRAGLSGACSTVSTFVAEINAQLKLVPEVLHGYIYAIGTLAAGALLGVLVYGSMVWSK